MFARFENKDKQSSPLIGGDKDKGSDSDVEANTNVASTTQAGTTTTGGNASTTTNRSRGLDLHLDEVEWRDTCCGTPHKKWCWAFSILVIFVILLVILITSLRKLESTEYGLEYHPRKKELDEAAKQGGLHIGPPGFKFVKFPSTFIVSCPSDALAETDVNLSR